MSNTRTSQATPSDDAIIPVRMVNELVYCPRLYYLMHVDGRWADNEYTTEGRNVHRRVDAKDTPLPDPAPTEGNDGDEAPVLSRSVSLASAALGISGKLDLVATTDDEAVPVETKRGRVPNNAERSYEPERVQLMAQGLLLREHGYRCERGILYFATSRTRVEITLDADLERRTLDAIGEAKRLLETRIAPDPLDDSPKCHGCSLAGICLPDETLMMKARAAENASREVRRLYPARDDAVPLYVQEQGAMIGKQRESLIVKKRGEELARARLKDVSQLVLCGNITVSQQATHMLCDAGIPIVHLSSGHWFYGITYGITLRNAYARAAQFAVAGDVARCLEASRAFVLAKGQNQRTLLRRNADPKSLGSTLRTMRDLLRAVPSAPSTQVLLGLEGSIAAAYFSVFSAMLRPKGIDASWDFSGRNRRPPQDPVNALLSFAYAILLKECSVALLAEGLDPHWGLFHQARHGKPALALDLMEEFRPTIADSAVLSAINTGMVTDTDFARTNAACMLSPSGRKSMLRALEARLDQLVTHPRFGYRLSWRATIRLQTRALARWLRGEAPDYLGMTTR